MLAGAPGTPYLTPTTKGLVSGITGGCNGVSGDAPDTRCGPSAPPVALRHEERKCEPWEYEERAECPVGERAGLRREESKGDDCERDERKSCVVAPYDEESGQESDDKARELEQTITRHRPSPTCHLN